MAYDIRFLDGLEFGGDWSWEEYFVSKCGIDYWKYKNRKQKLTRQSLEAHLDEFISGLESERDDINKKGLYKDSEFRFDSIAIAYQILAVLILETGAILPEKVKIEVLKWTKWSYEKKRHWHKSVVEDRRFFLRRFRTIIRIYTTGRIYRFSGGVLESSELDEIPHYEIEIEGLDNFRKILKNKEYNSISSISLKECKLKSIPKDLFLFVNLKYLNLADNYLTRISPKIQDLQKLEILNITNNRLMSIPKEISALKEIKSLELSKNNLEIIPNEIGELISLRELGLSSNKIKELPESIGKLPLLRMISIIGNPMNYDELEKLYPQIFFI